MPANPRRGGLGGGPPGAPSAASIALNRRASTDVTATDYDSDEDAARPPAAPPRGDGNSSIAQDSSIAVSTTVPLSTAGETTTLTDGDSMFDDSVDELGFAFDKNGAKKGPHAAQPAKSPTAAEADRAAAMRAKGRPGQKGKKGAELTVYDYVPRQYQYNPTTAEPILYYLPKTMQSLATQAAQTAAAAVAAQQAKVAAGAAPPSSLNQPNISPAIAPTGATLRTLFNAAEEDVRLHRARIKAAKSGDLRALRTYRLENDPAFLNRQELLEERAQTIQTLEADAEAILKDLKAHLEDPKKIKQDAQLTPAERQQLQLARWQKALELYVYCPAGKVKEGGAGVASAATAAAAAKDPKGHHKKKGKGEKDHHEEAEGTGFAHDMDHYSILDKLLEGTSEEQDDISALLAEASNLCQDLVQVTGKICACAAEQVSAQEEAYQIRLEGHELFLQTALTKAEEIQEQFKINGRAALQIGHQLEFAESKRRQCESASKLIRLWWLLEDLAEGEARAGEPIRVDEEVRGNVPQASCRMHPLFVRPEQSLEAARALKQLRAVVRSRGNATATGSNPGGTSAAAAAAAAAVAMGPGERSPIQRFDLTANLIARTSDALEQRLLHSFSEIYAQGGSYDFSSKPRPGSIDWRELQALAEALLMFDSGRNLHKRYVDMVIGSRFPELFDKKDKDDDDRRFRRHKDEDADMDETRSTLTTLFHKVSEVCSAEFELISHVFGSDQTRTDPLEGNETMPLVVARALLQRVISDPNNGLQARINDILASIDRKGDFDAGAKKLDTFVIIHEKAAGLFALLKEAALCMIPKDGGAAAAAGGGDGKSDKDQRQIMQAARNSVESLRGFLTSQELSLSNTHRQGYINLELRLLHHECCSSLDKAGCTLVKPPPPKRLDTTLAEKGILEEYRAPVLPLDKPSLYRAGFKMLLAGPLKPSVLRQPLVHAADSLARARLMFGSGDRKKGGETTARVVTSIYSQMCSFYGEGFLYPIMEVLRDSRRTNPPAEPPVLPFNEEEPAHDLGVEPAFWVSLERVHSAAKAFDREMWAEGREDGRVWEVLEKCESPASTAVARGCRFEFYSELERRGEAAILRALDSLSAHIHWILVTGGEKMMATGGKGFMQNITGQQSGPYAIPSGANLDTPNSPAVKSLTYCLRVQFVHVQSALTPESLSGFWTALSMRLYDILVARLLQHYLVSTVGAVILSRDVEALRSVAMLAGTQHGHWDTLRELLTLYMTGPEAVKNMLVGPEGDVSSGKGLFAKAGRDQALVFLSRRVDYRYKTGGGTKRSIWAENLLQELGVSDPSEGRVNIGLFAAERKP